MDDGAAERAICEAVRRGDLDGAIAGVHRLPAGRPARGRLAAGLVGPLAAAALKGDMRRYRQLDEMLAAAQENPPPGPQWLRARAFARILALLGAGMQRRLPDPVGALAELAELAEDLGDDGPARILVETARSILTYLRATQDGIDAGPQYQADIERIKALAADYPQAAAGLDFLALAAEVLANQEQGGDVLGPLGKLKAQTDHLPPDSPAHAVMAEIHTLTAPFTPATGGRFDVTGPPAPDQFGPLEDLADRPESGPATRALSHLSMGGALLDGCRETDLGRIGAAIKHFQAAVDLAAPDLSQRVFAYSSLAMGLMRRNELTNDLADLNGAAQALEKARELAGGYQHPQWAKLSDMLSFVRRRQGETDSREYSLDALRAVAWHVLLQNDATGARSAARGAARDAMDTALQCLADDDLADAIRALDGGRGLLLFAATEFHDVVPRLLAAGRPELAERWERTVVAGEPDRFPTDLRRDVLTVLAEDSGLLDPPDLPEIRAALRTLDADALVYLMPNGPQGGMAVIASAAGPPVFMALPNLAVDKELDVERYFEALSRDLPAPVLVPPEQSAGSFAETVDKLCEWAWSAAMGPLYDLYLSKLPKPASGRPYRVILVPMGELAMIPWQAARRKDGVYAVQLAAFSYAASARMLCRSAALAPVPPTPAGLIVGDPETGGPARRLPAARAEAYALHQAFYRGGRYLGTRADGSPSRAGAGTREHVRDWLTSSRPAAGAMLHLACHGVIDTGEQDTTAYLLLADGGKVTAAEIIQLMLTAPQRAIGLAVLAACHTGKSIYGYDEAYSLGTAFLAGGVRSVLSTQWAVPDQETSVLMFMFHHHLMVDHLPVWAALRQAQLWMLDPDREPPPTMPDRLRRELAAAEHAARIDAWAGFIHWGQ